MRIDSRSLGGAVAAGCLAITLAACDATSNLGSNQDDAGWPDTGAAVSADASSSGEGDAADAADAHPDAGADAGELACDGPEDCPAAVCCAAVLTGAGKPPACPLASLHSACTATCNTNIPLTQCETTTTLRLCHASADCANEPSGATACCSYQAGPVNFCLPPSLAKGLSCK